MLQPQDKRYQKLSFPQIPRKIISRSADTAPRGLASNDFRDFHIFNWRVNRTLIDLVVAAVDIGIIVAFCEFSTFITRILYSAALWLWRAF